MCIRSMLCLLIMCALFEIPEVSAQRKKKRNQQVQRTVNTYADDDFFAFPNVNKIPYYEDASLLKKIKQLEKKENWEEIYPLLKEYVANFGIINFYRDTYWLWRLAKLTEVYGDRSKAILLYRLVLKHHRDGLDMDAIIAEYDAITMAESVNYADLDYYYNLVNFKNQVDTLYPPPGYMVNMGKDINSKQDDYAPALNASDDMLIFTSRRNTVMRNLETVENEDLFISRKIDGVFRKAMPFEDINTEFNEGSACISKDGKTIYFSRCGSPEGYGDCDIYETHLEEDSTWTKPVNLGVMVNSKAWDSHPSLTHGDDTLFYASDRIGGFGLVDIYFTYKDEEGQWTRAQNAGPIINTRNSEVSPYYHHLYNTLYFSSNGHILNFGNYDIYKSKWEGINWSEPQNVGPLVNTEGSEYYFTIDSQSKDLFYAKSQKKDYTNLDLYSFPLPMGAQPGDLVTLQGTFETGPYMGIVSIIDMDEGVDIAPRLIRQDGSFDFELINNRNYLLIIQSDNFLDFEQFLFIDSEMDINATGTPIATMIKFESIQFDEGDAELKPEMFTDLDNLADFLSINIDFYLTVSGHTDKGGSEEFNLELSQRRAETIKEYLVYFGGVDESRIEAKGFGSSQPLVVENTEEDRELNRRVEFDLVRK